MNADITRLTTGGGAAGVAARLTRPPRLLVVEDDRDLAANVAEYFEPRGYEIDFAYDGKAALALALAQAPGVVVLDLGLPRLDGVAVSTLLRARGFDAPILVLSARDGLDDKAAAFEAGADDYLTKPFALAELEMRVRALERRHAAQGRCPILRVADLSYDTGTLEVSRAGVALRLNRTERTLLALLMRASPNVVPRQTIVTQLWGDEPPGADTLRTHVFALRKAIDKPFDVPLLHTEHGQGYALRPPSA